MKNFSNVYLIVEGYKMPFMISWFKKGKSKITKEEYGNYLYSNAINFGLFYVGYCKKCDSYKWSIDIASELGILRIIKK